MKASDARPPSPVGHGAGQAALACQRDAFSIREGVHYLNCAYAGPLPKVAEAAGIAGLTAKRTPTDIVPPTAFWEGSDALKAAFARLVNAPHAQRIAIHPGVSYAVATAAKNLPLSRGGNVVITHEQFPGNVYGWSRAAADAGASVHAVQPPPGAERGAGWNERILDAIGPHTGVVALPHVHWTDGTLFDLEAIGARCRDVGAALVVDATQSVGALPFDVERVQPDVLVCAAYKWLLGPYSMALTWLSERFDDGIPIEETWIGRKHSEDFRNLVDYQDGYQPGAARYDVAERSNFALVPVAQASIDLLLEWRPERIQAYCADLTADLLQRAQELGFTLEDSAWRARHLFGLRMPEGIDLAALSEALAERGVIASLRGSALRVSPNVYNDATDIEALLDVLTG